MWVWISQLHFILILKGIGVEFLWSDVPVDANSQEHLCVSSQFFDFVFHFQALSETFAGMLWTDLLHEIVESLILFRHWLVTF